MGRRCAKNVCAYSYRKMKPVKNIANNIKHVDYMVGICNHYCRNQPRKANFYDWFGYLDGRFIKRMCEKCALRERWGYNYKQQKAYKRWVG